MSSQGVRKRDLPCSVGVPKTQTSEEKADKAKLFDVLLGTGKQITVSESHPYNRKLGRYEGGGPFYTSKVEFFANPAFVKRCCNKTVNSFYSGPIMVPFPTTDEMKAVGFKNLDLEFESENSDSLKADGATAIALSAPTNPSSTLGTGLAELYREGLPSLPGISTWRNRTRILKSAGDEYLNQVFGWLPLVSEVKDVGSAAIHARDIVKYHKSMNGKDIHRTFTFSSQSESSSIEGSARSVGLGINETFLAAISSGGAFKDPVHTVSRTRDTHRYFKGCFSFTTPTDLSAGRKLLGFGSQADQLFGIALDPVILWELAPWSWAVDWFSNTQDVITNARNFALAGLSMRYGYMMEETIENVTSSLSHDVLLENKSGKAFGKVVGGSSCGYTVTTKRRVAANPFGFSLGWEDLSPTQLAITAALGITRVL